MRQGRESIFQLLLPIRHRAKVLYFGLLIMSQFPQFCVLHEMVERHIHTINPPFHAGEEIGLEDIVLHEGPGKDEQQDDQTGMGAVLIFVHGPELAVFVVFLNSLFICHVLMVDQIG